jgi:hypothetical protein
MSHVDDWMNDPYRDYRSVTRAVQQGTCPACLGHAGLGLVCYDCGQDVLLWKGEIRETSEGGKLLIAEIEAMAERQERFEQEEADYRAAVAETVARWY